MVHIPKQRVLSHAPVPWLLRTPSAHLRTSPCWLLRTSPPFAPHTSHRDNRVQWETLLDLVAQATPSDADANPELARAAAAATATLEATANAAAKSEAMKEAVSSLLGSTQGRALRLALNDLDSTDLASKLLSKEARPMRHAAGS